jgi:hypothetical protein
MVGEINDGQVRTMRESREKVIEISKKFIGFDEVIVASPQIISDIIAAQ